MSIFNFDPDFFRRVISKCEKTQKIKSLTQLIKEATETFYDEYDYYPDIGVCAPGTFTIMGDHLEYVEGYLVQAALPMLTVIVGKSFDAVKCKIVTTSRNVEGLRKAVFPISHYKKNLKVFPEWVNFIKGVIGVYPCQNIKGFDAVIHSNVPVGQGYGSSAALQVGFYTFLEAICEKKICENKEKKGKLCQLAEIQSKMFEKRIGQWDNYTSSIALGSTLVLIDCSKKETSTFEMKDIDILFLLTHPNFEIEKNDRDCIPIREIELKLVAKLLGLEHVKYATESDLEVLANMEDPTKEAVIEILRELGVPDEILYPFVDDLFSFPKRESVLEDEQSYIEEGGEYYNNDIKESFLRELGENDSEVEKVVVEEITGEREIVMEEIKKGPCIPKVEKKWFPPAPPPSPVSYIHQRIAELCEGKVGSEIEMPQRICEEINCLGGIDNLSVSSDLTVCSKLLRRLRHVITEKMRCLELPEILKRLDYVEFGNKLIQSHLSLKIDFDVSCPTLDGLVQLAIETERAYGAKMMSGGGTLTLLHRSVVEEFVAKVIEKFGDAFQFYLVFPSPGARILNLEVKKNPKSSLSNYYPNLMEVSRAAIDGFLATYKYKPTHGAYSPGALNVIGDHTDYNNGFILALAVNLLVVVVGAFNGTNKIRVATTGDVGGEPQKAIFSLSLSGDLGPGRVNWVKLIKGAIVHFKGVTRGFDCFIQSSLPTKSGFSCKTPVVVAVYSFLEELFERKTACASEKSYYCMLAEQEFSKTIHGIGGHSVITRAKENFMVLFDCRTTLSNLIPFQDPSVLFLLTFVKMNVKSIRAVFFRRMEECYDAAKVLGKKTLRCFTKKDFENLKNFNVSRNSIKRARHILTENERVLKGAEALRNNDYETLGELMVASHNSLRDDYEVTSPELDYLVKCAMEVDGVLGSKMPSCGYQTCTLSLVKRWAVDDLIEYLQNNFSGILNFYVINPSPGCGPIQVKSYVDNLHGPEFVFEDIFRC